MQPRRTGAVRVVEDILKENELVVSNRAECIKASRENVQRTGELHEFEGVDDRADRDGTGWRGTNVQRAT